MRILLTESDPGVGDAAFTALDAAGHRVARCTHAEAPAFPCHGLAGGTCPVEDHVDVVLAVRARAGDEPSPREMGVTCALRRHVPLVVAAGPGPDPFAAWTTTRVVGDDPVAIEDALTEAAAGELTAHAAVAADEARRRTGGATTARAVRDGDRLAVEVVTGADLDHAQRETLGVQVAGAVRRFDPWTGVIDVAVRPSS